MSDTRQQTDLRWRARISAGLDNFFGAGAYSTRYADGVITAVSSVQTQNDPRALFAHVPRNTRVEFHNVPTKRSREAGFRFIRSDDAENPTADSDDSDAESDYNAFESSGAASPKPESNNKDKGNSGGSGFMRQATIAIIITVVACIIYALTRSTN